MKTGRMLLELLENYGTKHVFGLPGETTLGLYEEWAKNSQVKYILSRDERSASFMADAYGRVSKKPGICEGPSVGSTHMVPGIAEAYKASVPMIAFTTDIPLHLNKKNMLTGLNQTAIFESLTKETLTVTRSSDFPDTLKTAYRVATSGKPGPVHIRLPMDILEDDADIQKQDLQAQEDYKTSPSQRLMAEFDKIKTAVNLISKSERPLFICGQGTLQSRAWKEVTRLAEFFAVPVGTTMTGKGSISEEHPLSIGVVGARGGTKFSNQILKDSDLIFYLGSNTDSASTDNWSLPPIRNDKKILHLDIDGKEIGNNYEVDVGLIGDVKSTIKKMLEISKSKARKKEDYSEIPRIKKIQEKRENHLDEIEGEISDISDYVHPIIFIKKFDKILPKDHFITADPGVGAIFTSAFYKVKEAGRTTLFNYAMGALGYSIPASIGAYYAGGEKCVVALTGDGSFGFTIGELETISRLDGNINVILFDNACYGWIRASFKFSGREKFFGTEFKSVNNVKIAEGFGLNAYNIEKTSELDKLEKAIKSDRPSLVNLKVPPEDKLVPPVPEWAKKAKNKNIDVFY